jgi:GAF domain-containing protein
MRDLAADFAWLNERAHSLLVRDARWRRLLQVGFVLGGAALGGIGEVAANIVADPIRPYAHSASIVGLVAVLIGGIVFAFVDEGTPETIARALAAIEGAWVRDRTIGELEAEFRWITQLYGTAKALREFVEAVLAAGAEEAKNASTETLSALLDMVVAQKDVLFGMTGERWNFAIYLYDRAADQLDCLICRRPIRAEETAPHRSWRPGEGHVGLAFSRDEELVASDTADPQIEQLFRAHGTRHRDDDTTRYRSIASIPIRIRGENPWGVLVATSDRAGRFRPVTVGSRSAIDHVEPLRVLATNLATAIDRAHILRRSEQAI